MMSYVQQNDVFNAHLTVMQTMIFAAFLRMPGSVPLKEKLKRINTILKLLGLEHAKGTVVGAPGIRKGISGGERKRLAIGVELLSHPSILFLDEPTTGF